jgi:hypothetical protein
MRCTLRLPILQHVGARSESAGAVGDEGGADLRDAMGKGELEVRGHELLDVRAAHVRGLFDLDHTQDLAGKGG